jgi:hypothetical protein
MNQILNVTDDHGVARLIANARTALDNCTRTRSEWGVQYWSNVLAYLLRQGQRLS